MSAAHFVGRGIEEVLTVGAIVVVHDIVALGELTDKASVQVVKIEVTEAVALAEHDKLAQAEVKMVVEGVYSAKAALELAKKFDVDMPIVQGVNEILFEGKSVEEGITDLMVRERRIENSSLDW